MNCDNDTTRLYIRYDLQWFAKEGPGGEKTEPATAKKLKDAREEGKVAKSKELVAGFELLALFLIIKLFTGYIADGFFEAFKVFYTKIPDVLRDSPGGFTIKTQTAMMNYAVMTMLKILAPCLIVSFLIAFVLNVVQVKWKPTAKPMQPKLSKLNPLSGFKRIFSKDSLAELLKSIVKIIIIGYVAFLCVRGESHHLFSLYDMPLFQAIALIGEVILDVGIKVSAVYIVFGFADYIYQQQKFKNEMKMTKQEVKDEFKNTEGNPEIKGRQRQRMREASQRRMMQDVPKADVVITNPTHLAVAIQYDPEVAKAPVVLAKGEDYLAMKIRETAKEHNIEIVENKPLARMLYANVDIGAEIPPELYQAVAEVLAMVYNLKHNS